MFLMSTSEKSLKDLASHSDYLARLNSCNSTPIVVIVTYTGVYHLLKIITILLVLFEQEFILMHM